MARSWDSAYVGEPPPWDIGRPQPIVEAIAAAGDNWSVAEIQPFRFSTRFGPSMTGAQAWHATVVRGAGADR